MGKNTYVIYVSGLIQIYMYKYTGGGVCINLFNIIFWIKNDIIYT